MRTSRMCTWRSPACASTRAAWATRRGAAACAGARRSASASASPSGTSAGSRVAFMSDAPATSFQLEGISPKAYEHPADRAATAALASIPYLDLVVRKLIELGYERALRGNLLGSAVRLGEDQLPRVWSLHHEAFHVLDLEPLPPLYLTQWPVANAVTMGTQRPLVVVNSQTVTLLDEGGLRAVLGHEAGHVLSDHILYQTALIILITGTPMAGPLLSLPLNAVKLAL